jgi:two-component system, OmpR family, phosphate regulon response regulator PhoB
MQETILIVEDEADVAGLLRYNLSKAGFGVLVASDGIEGLEIARKDHPDLIVLDLLLPEMNGYAVCRKLREDSNTVELPILILTAKAETNERIKGLELGADDYVTKPFSPRELVLRVQGLLRRSSPSKQMTALEVGPFKVDDNGFDIRLEGRRLDLTMLEFKLLAILIERRGRIQSRESLLSEVWGYQKSVDSRTVDTHMSRLREKLGQHGASLETVRFAGYRFNPHATIAHEVPEENGNRLS